MIYDSQEQKDLVLLLLKMANMQFSFEELGGSEILKTRKLVQSLRDAPVAEVENEDEDKTPPSEGLSLHEPESLTQRTGTGEP